MTWSAWTGNAIALIGIGYTWWANRGTRQAAADAGQQAAESLATAKEATAAQQRMADVLEKMYEAQERRAAHPAVAEAVAPDLPGSIALRASSPVRWLVEHTGDGVYRLTNAGSATAYDVRMTSSDAALVHPPAGADGGTWTAGESADFSATPGWHIGVPMVVVSWRDEMDGEVRGWERVIPR